MKKKIKLTEKDLKLNISSGSENFSSNNTSSREYPTLQGCQTQTSCYYCPPVVSDVCEKTQYCGEPVTKDTACVVSAGCQTKNTCIIESDPCMEPATVLTLCGPCEETDNCAISNKCQETEVCEVSYEGGCETVPCPFSENNCEQPNTLIADCRSVELNCLTLTDCGNY